jgi:hypothetical protein
MGPYVQNTSKVVLITIGFFFFRFTDFMKMEVAVLKLFRTLWTNNFVQLTVIEKVGPRHSSGG